MKQDAAALRELEKFYSKLHVPVRTLAFDKTAGEQEKACNAIAALGEDFRGAAVPVFDAAFKHSIAARVAGSTWSQQSLTKAALNVATSLAPDDAQIGNRILLLSLTPDGLDSQNKPFDNGWLRNAAVRSLGTVAAATPGFRRTIAKRFALGLHDPSVLAACIAAFPNCGFASYDALPDLERKRTHQDAAIRTAADAAVKSIRHHRAIAAHLIRAKIDEETTPAKLFSAAFHLVETGDAVGKKSGTKFKAPYSYYGRKPMPQLFAALPNNDLKLTVLSQLAVLPDATDRDCGATRIGALEELERILHGDVKHRSRLTPVFAKAAALPNSDAAAIKAISFCGAEGVRQLKQSIGQPKPDAARWNSLEKVLWERVRTYHFSRDGLAPPRVGAPRTKQANDPTGPVIDAIAALGEIPATSKPAINVLIGRLYSSYGPKEMNLAAANALRHLGKNDLAYADNIWSVFGSYRRTAGSRPQTGPETLVVLTKILKNMGLDPANNTAYELSMLLHGDSDSRRKSQAVRSYGLKPEAVAEVITDKAKRKSYILAYWKHTKSERRYTALKELPVWLPEESAPVVVPDLVKELLAFAKTGMGDSKASSIIRGLGNYGKYAGADAVKALRAVVAMDKDLLKQPRRKDYYAKLALDALQRISAGVAPRKTSRRRGRVK